MRLLNILFYRLFSFAYKTNKSVTEWSTIITMSILFTLNVISISVFFNVSIEAIGKNGFRLLPVLFIVLNWFYFLKGNRYKKLIQAPPISNNLVFVDILIIIYIIISVCFFYLVLEIGLKYIFISISLLAIVLIIAYFDGNSRKT